MIAFLLSAHLLQSEPWVAPDELISVQQGDIPIILSAPHGGGVRIDGSKDRTKGVTVRDTNVGEVAWLTAQRLTELAKGKPYVIIAHFSRKDADANRAPDEAYENEAAKRHYDAYHRALRRAVDECRSRFKCGLLVDIHGQAQDLDAIYRGTRDGASLTRLIQRHGIEAAVGPDSLMGRLKARGYKTLPEFTADSLGKETSFNGGFITERYGSNQSDGVDTIQIEIGHQRTERTLTFSRDLAAAIHAGMKFYAAP